jgi:hypothetical protein
VLCFFFCLFIFVLFHFLITSFFSNGYI